MVYPLPTGAPSPASRPSPGEAEAAQWGGTPFPLSLVLSPSPLPRTLLPFLILSTPSSLSPLPHLC